MEEQMLAELLARYDAKVAECPINRHGYRDTCPKCKATSSQTCGLTDGAAYVFIAEAREHLKSLTNTEKD